LGDRLETLADNWTRAWNEREADNRRVLLADCFADDGRFQDLFLLVDGRAVLVDRNATTLTFGAPGSLRRVGAVQQCADAVRFGWRITSSAGTVVANGTNYAEVTLDVRFQRVVGFWDTHPRPPSGIA
jgi:hypothetical protein